MVVNRTGMLRSRLQNTAILLSMFYLASFFPYFVFLLRSILVWIRVRIRARLNISCISATRTICFSWKRQWDCCSKFLRLWWVHWNGFPLTGRCDGWSRAQRQKSLGQGGLKVRGVKKVRGSKCQRAKMSGGQKLGGLKSQAHTNLRIKVF